MVDPKHIHEPPIDPLADTNPSLTIRKVQIDPHGTAGWRKSVGLLSLLVAAGLTVATAIVLMMPKDTPAPIPTIAVENTLPPPEVPTDAVVVPTSVISVPQDGQSLIPTVSAETIASILNAPLQNMNTATGSFQIIRDNFDPFTTIPDRPRSEVIQYTAVQGDTIYTIAERFKLKPETIAWSNPRRYIEVLHPGDIINVPPVDGVYTQIIGNKSIADVAATYQVSDPFTVTDSEFNNLFGTSPDTVLPSGTWLFIPGGTGEDITWNPGVTVDTSGGKTQGYVLSFAPGQPGSCNVSNNPGGTAWANPLPGSTFVRGFSAIHSGVDLSAAPGTPVHAANGGVVIYSGWNNWGYGNLIVVASGPFLELYGHLSSISARCGQIVSAGSVIGGVGSTGNSSGPHLHFEIRFGQTPTDPLATMPGLGL